MAKEKLNEGGIRILCHGIMIVLMFSQGKYKLNAFDVVMLIFFYVCVCVCVGVNKT